MFFRSIQFPKRRRIPLDGLDLADFLFSAKIRSLYRKTLRETRNLGTNQVRRETISWIRYEFVKPLQSVKREVRHQDLIAQINRQLKEIRNQSMLIGGNFEKLSGGRNFNHQS